MLIRSLTCRCICAVALLALAVPARGEGSKTLGLSGTNYGSEGTFPQIDMHYQKWHPGGPGVDVTLSTLVLLNELDLTVTYPIGDRVKIIPKLGPTVWFGYFGGRTGLAAGVRFSAQRPGGRGVAIDLTHRMFSGEDDTALPITGVGVSLLWGSPQASATRP